MAGTFHPGRWFNSRKPSSLRSHVITSLAAYIAIKPIVLNAHCPQNNVNSKNSFIDEKTPCFVNILVIVSFTGETPRKKCRTSSATFLQYLFRRCSFSSIVNTIFELLAKEIFPFYYIQKCLSSFLDHSNWSYYYRNNCCSNMPHFLNFCLHLFTFSKSLK